MISTFIKIRPPLSDESLAQNTISHDEKVLIFNDSSTALHADQIYDTGDSQKVVFKTQIQNLIDLSLTSQANPLVLVFGAQTSGKTYIVEGNIKTEEQRGIIFEILLYLSEQQAQVEYSCCVVQNDSVLDVLTDQNTKICKNNQRTFLKVQSRAQLVDITIRQRNNVKQLSLYLTSSSHKVHTFEYIVEGVTGEISVVDSNLIYDQRLSLALTPILSQFAKISLMNAAQKSVTKRSTSTGKNFATRTHELTKLLDKYFSVNGVLLAGLCLSCKEKSSEFNKIYGLLGTLFKSNGQQFVDQSIKQSNNSLQQILDSQNMKMNNLSRSQINKQTDENAIQIQNEFSSATLKNQFPFYPKTTPLVQQFSNLSKSRQQIDQCASQQQDTLVKQSLQSGRLLQSQITTVPQHIQEHTIKSSSQQVKAQNTSNNHHNERPSINEEIHNTQSQPRIDYLTSQIKQQRDMVVTEAKKFVKEKLTEKEQKIRELQSELHYMQTQSLKQSREMDQTKSIIEAMKSVKNGQEQLDFEKQTLKVQIQQKEDQIKELQKCQRLYQMQVDENQKLQHQLQDMKAKRQELEAKNQEIKLSSSKTESRIDQKELQIQDIMIQNTQLADANNKHVARIKELEEVNLQQTLIIKQQEHDLNDFLLHKQVMVQMEQEIQQYKLDIDSKQYDIEKLQFELTAAKQIFQPRLRVEDQ